MTGLRVFMKRELLNWDAVELFETIPTSNIADCMYRTGAMNSEIRLMSRGKDKNMLGFALTVRLRPGDNLLLHKALDMAGEHDVIVVSNEGTQSHSLLGEIMTVLAEQKKIAGLVLDGPIRDIDAISVVSLPVYATGVTPGGPYKTGPGEVNVPVSCGGVCVCPGDVVVGDRDGVIIAPKRDALDILAKALDFQREDRAKLEAAKNCTAQRDWVDRTLRALQCEIVDDFWRP